MYSQTKIIPENGRSTVSTAHSITQRFCAHATANPRALAVASGTQSLSYAELDRRSNTLAAHLRSLGAAPETVVGVHLPRSLDLLVGILGIVKTGAAYMPMDPSYPAERLRFMAEDVGAALVLTSSHTCDFGDSRPVHMDKIKGYSPIMDDVAVIPELDSLAYVIYTSGSTGSPKGVEITHRGLSNLVTWHQRVFSVSANDRASHLAGLGFDASVWEMWPYLVSGASLHLASDHERTDPEALRDWLVAERITISFIPTPIAERMLGLTWPRETCLRLLLTGGDVLHSWPPPGLPFELINNYGPTETTVVATSGLVMPGHGTADLPSIGKPIDNVQVHILDSDLQPVGEGEIGELYIGGASVGRGYVGRPDLTAERFVSNPQRPDEKLYRTGDLGHQRADGQIAFMGRADDQVKIRGYRIELDEITAVLNTCPEVKASIVVARPDKEQHIALVGYIVPRNGHLTRGTLHQHLSQYLPDYMVPATFVSTADLPLTSNGKVDRAALPAPTRENIMWDKPCEDPLNIIEEQVAATVADVLQFESVGREENFFMLGGHSLLGIQLIARLRDVFDVEVPLRTLFEKPTIVHLSAEIESLILTKLGAEEAGSARPQQQ